jgi:hypothetical protein
MAVASAINSVWRTLSTKKEKAESNEFLSGFEESLARSSRWGVLEIQFHNNCSKNLFQCQYIVSRAILSLCTYPCYSDIDRLLHLSASHECHLWKVYQTSLRPWLGLIPCYGVYNLWLLISHVPVINCLKGLAEDAWWLMRQASHLLILEPDCRP